MDISTLENRPVPEWWHSPESSRAAAMPVKTNRRTSRFPNAPRIIDVPTIVFFTVLGILLGVVCGVRWEQDVQQIDRDVSAMRAYGPVDGRTFDASGNLVIGGN